MVLRLKDICTPLKFTCCCGWKAENNIWCPFIWEKFWQQCKKASSSSVVYIHHHKQRKFHKKIMPTYWQDGLSWQLLFTHSVVSTKADMAKVKKENRQTWIWQHIKEAYLSKWIISFSTEFLCEDNRWITFQSQIGASNK